MSTWDDPVVRQALADADLSVTCRRWTSDEDETDIAEVWGG